MKHLYTTKDQRSEEKSDKEGETVGYFYFFQSTSYSYRFNPMDYIHFVPLSL